MTEDKQTQDLRNAQMIFSFALKKSHLISSNCFEFTDSFIRLLKMGSLPPGQAYISLLNKYFVYHKVLMPGHVCARLINRGEDFFYCLDCAANTQCCVCYQCFSKSNHQGHNFKKKIAKGGRITCDCGDDERWKLEGTCNPHQDRKQNLQINKKQLQNFIKEMKFVCELFFYMFDLNGLAAYISFLINFNEGSIISNEMTFQLLLSNIDKEWENQGIKKQNIIIDLIFALFQFKDVSNLAVNLFIGMLDRVNFKKYLIAYYMDRVNKNPFLFLSEYDDLAMYLSTSHKLINQLINQKKLVPLMLKPIQNITFETVNQIQGRFFQFLGGLDKDVGANYWKFYFQEIKITDLTTFQDHLAQEVDYLNIFQFISNCITYLKRIEGEKMIIRKCIRDVVELIKNHNRQENSKIQEISCSFKMLVILLFINFDGYICKSINIQFLDQIKIDEQILQVMLKMVHANLEMYCNFIRSDQQRLSQYFFGKNPHLLVSIDYQSFKFCISAGSQLRKRKSQKNQSNYSSNFVEFLKNQSKTQSSVYLLPIFNELINCNHSSLCIRANIGKLQQQEALQFYGSLLKTVTNCKIQQFKQLCVTFLSYDLPILDIFVKEFCKIENHRIRLLPQKQKLFTVLNLHYLESKKLNSILKKLLDDLKIGYQLQQSIVNQLEVKYHHLVKEQLFSSDFIDVLCQSVKQISGNYRSPSQRYLLSSLVKSFIILYYTTADKNVLKTLQKFAQNQDWYNNFDKCLSIELSKFKTKQSSALEIISKTESQSKQQQIKQRKLEKMKEKQSKILQQIVITESPKKSEVETNPSVNCMYCKLSDQEQVLSALCFVQQSTFFSSYYLGCSRPVKIYTSCQHFAHVLCIAESGNELDQTECILCRCFSNTQLTFKTNFNLSQVQKKDIIIKQIDKQAIKISEQQQTVQTIAVQILYGAIIDPIFFNKSLSLTCYSLLQSLSNNKFGIQNLIDCLRAQQASSKPNQQQKIFWNAYNFTILEITKLLKIQTNYNTQDISIPKQLKQNITKTINSMITQQALQLQPYKPPKIRELPKQLQKLGKQCTPCPHCHKITNQIYLCLLCEFKTCDSCEISSIKQHCKIVHHFKSIFIQAYIGEPRYFCERGSYQFQSLYEDYLGQAFVDRNKIYTKSGYLLNQQRYTKCANDIIWHRIQQEIRYKIKHQKQ